MEQMHTSLEQCDEAHITQLRGPWLTPKHTRTRSVIAQVNAGVGADVLRRERAEWERVIAEFEKLTPPKATVRQVEVNNRLIPNPTS